MRAECVVETTSTRSKYEPRHVIDFPDIKSIYIASMLPKLGYLPMFQEIPPFVSVSGVIPAQTYILHTAVYSV